MAESTVVSNGLEGIIVAETQISEVDGLHGRLIIRGRDAEELAFASTFEETCGLLWSGADRVQPSTATLQKQFARARVEAFDLLEANPTILKQVHPMDALRTATSLLTSGTEVDPSEYARITAAIGVIVANWSRYH
ncbi:MAG: citrate/2-methylcitrate synthase, partial [Terriglobales bacterium]